VGTVEKQVALRQQMMQQACDAVHHRPLKLVGLMAGQSWMNSRANCYWNTLHEAVEAQRRYALLLAQSSLCMRTHLHNQMELSWTPDAVIGAFYVFPEDAPFARRLVEALVQRRHRDGQSPREHQLCGLPLPAVVR